MKLTAVEQIMRLLHPIKIYLDSIVHTISESSRIQKNPLWSADLKSCGFVCQIHMNSWDTCGQKANLKRKSCGFNKYPDTCGPGLNCNRKFSLLR